MLKAQSHPLKIARERRNLTQQELADFAGLGIATIQRAERGQKLRPDVRKRLCDYFDRTPLELGLVTENEEEPVNKQSSDISESGNNDVHRREFLQTIGVAGATLFVPSQLATNFEPWERFLKALKRPSNIDETTLNHLEMLAQNSWQLIPDITGVVSNELRDYAINHLLNVTELLEGSHTDTNRKRLTSIGGEFSMIAASMSANLRDFDKAQSFYNVSIEAAREANNQSLEAVGLASLAIRLTHLNQANKALPLVQEARRLTTQSGTTTMRTWLAAVEAEVQANLKDYPACFRALEYAEHVPQQYLISEDPYMTTFNPSLFAGYKGVCHMQFGEPDAAYRVLSEALAHLNSPSISRRCYILTDLASTCIERKEIEEACTYARQALALTIQAKSPALWQRINDIRKQLEAWQDIQDVKDFNDQLRTVKDKPVKK
ncbi:MAG TPA: helix-turn-helix domain-containing protein [Ktedonobacteraceae bacterium]|nr:helix-turn-helix domain-containing protein [Ktedonobacteraceae bacterium]